MTPYQRLRGKTWTIPLPCFGEAVEYKRRTRHKLESRWERGVFLGVEVDTAERIVGMSQKVFVVQSIRRVPEDQRYNSELLLSIKGLPWKPTPETGDSAEAMELPMPISITPDTPDVPPVPAVAADGERKARRYYITTRDLERYGYTQGCPACDAIRARMDRIGILHSPRCRERVEDLSSAARAWPWARWNARGA